MGPGVVERESWVRRNSMSLRTYTSGIHVFAYLALNITNLTISTVIDEAVIVVDVGLDSENPTLVTSPFSHQVINTIGSMH